MVESHKSAANAMRDCDLSRSLPRGQGMAVLALSQPKESPVTAIREVWRPYHAWGPGQGWRHWPWGNIHGFEKGSFSLKSWVETC